MANSQDDLIEYQAVRDAAALSLNNAIDRPCDWKSQGVGYQRTFLGVAHLLADIQRLDRDPELLSLRHRPASVPLTDRTGKRTPIWAMAASLVMAVVAGLWFYGQQAVAPGLSMDRHVTRVGEQKRVELDDGSVITLNTGSELLVGLSGTERKVILRRGEAYFDVARDSSRPFSVDAGLRTVTVLGTAFNLRKSPDRLQLAVTEGTVALHAEGEVVSSTASLISTDNNTSGLMAGQYRLQAGWVAEVEAREQELMAYRGNMESLALWRTGALDFDNTPLMDVVRELNRYSGKKILIEDSSIMELAVLGVIQVHSIDQAVRGLEYTLPIKATHYFDRIVLTGS